MTSDDSAHDEPTGLEIAVIGMAGRFPGAASTDEFWEVVRAGRETISRFSEAELDAAEVPAETRSRADFVPAGGVLADADLFDNELFGYTPRDAALLDPQQRLFLETSWSALEDAGYGSPYYQGLTGVYASTSLSTYLLHHLGSDPAALDGVTLHELMLANDKDSLATRVAYHLDLQGPAITVQSGCSSSLVAVHLACQALLSRECDVALAGGVSLHVPQREGYRAVRGGVMSADGHVYAFDRRATGTVNGDGVAAVVLKPLADALRDRDTVHAVIKGSAVNNDGGRKVGFTAPRAEGQAAVIRTAHLAAGVSPDSISYVETHGTGTALGDPIEYAALQEAFDTDGPQDRTGCALGSVKPSIGHLDAAAGVTGMIKAVLALRHRTIPPSPYFREPNPEIDLASGPFHVPDVAAAWPPGDGPRRAGVSSFGMGGTNAHVVLEEAPVPPERIAPRRSAQVLVVSGASERALADNAAALGRALAERPDVDLADAAFTSQLGRRALPYRAAVVAANRGEASARLAARAAGAGPSAGDGPAPRERRIAFLFPGQGAQHHGMAAGLHAVEPAFRTAFDRCADLLADELHSDLRVVTGLVPDPAGTAADLLDRTEYTQPALFATEYALACLWAEWGVHPRAMLGHSVGEYVAACLAGTFELEDAVRVVAARGRLMQKLPPGQMVSVHLSADELTRLLPAGVSLAAANGPRLSTASGPAEGIDRLVAELTGRGIRHSLLRTSHAFHSAMTEPVLDEFTALLSSITLRPPKIPFISNLNGRWITSEQATDPVYWARHLRDTVRFDEGARQLLDGADPYVLLEVGPGTTLTTLVRQQSLAEGGHVAVGSLGHPRQAIPDGQAVLSAAATLFTSGVTIDWDGFWRHEEPGRVPLPTYAFERRRHWLGSRPEQAPTAAPAPAPSASPPAGDESVGDRVRVIWQELLGMADVGPQSDFFALGGHSLLATQLAARVSDDLAVDLSGAALFDAPTLGEFAELVERAAPSGESLPGDLVAELDRLTPAELEELLSEGTDG
ncbi:type I polyketide synthase [Streptomyces arenae]|uniref:type I polyketide synthase n=1 Tax=Streptomyces arenae TaxID=29301 RepID=UPI002657FF93|nr:beta-ketoacyl synthase N-terminal-like domain-containing protein [Streptomyces arenae]MCG7204959.1 acyltransferase domain-containing protein [Streptomyces arenae]